MLFGIGFLKHNFILDSISVFTGRLVPLLPFLVRNMDPSITEEVSKLLTRLSEAERRAKLLKSEIKNIRTQIAGLTESAHRIINETGVSSTNNILRSAHTLASSNTRRATTLKRDREETDSSETNEIKRSKEDLVLENGYVVVYTDGACENNGKANAKAGIGVWFGDLNGLNISEPVKGRATNNTAEIQAPTEALKVLKNLGYSKVKIFTDSQFTINCITKWIQKWKKNQWKLAGGGPVKNKEDLVKLDELCGQFQDIKWEYCAGHRGIKGNEEADKLAREGALRKISLILTMADEDPVNGTSDENSEKSQQKKQAKYDSGAADLEKVTDYAEEKEISTQDVADAISAIGDRRNQAALEKQAREKELLKVSIKKEDVDLIVKEMEISRAKAERTLRENHGNVVNALISLTN